ncbi:MAG: flagellar biosynthetic protein FliO [Gammaproteobacteria bacterium]|nr:flagellar biosynthetic protein FliO [Gammaproteobacteria bacterium]
MNFTSLAQQRLRDLLRGGVLFIVPLTVFSAPLVQPSSSTLSPTAPTPTASAVTDPLSLSALMEVTLMLLLVVALIFVLAWLFRRISVGGLGGNHPIRVLGGVSVGTRERVILIQVGDEQLLLGVAPGRINTLHQLRQPLSTTAGGDSAAAEAEATSFAEKLQRMMTRSGEAK